MLLVLFKHQLTLSVAHFESQAVVIIYLHLFSDVERIRCLIYWDAIDKKGVARPIFINVYENMKVALRKKHYTVTFRQINVQMIAQPVVPEQKGRSIY